jgi:glycosyltransferase involved in cell wall biosynthesis
MKDIAILMPCWKSPELLKISIPSLIKATKTNSEIIVILNEPDLESVKYLDSIGVKHIDVLTNDGPAAVDHAIPYMKKTGFKYVANVNSDMLFSEGWDIELLKLHKQFSPCTVSCCLVEPINGGQGIFEYLDFYDTNSHDIFNKNLQNGKYKTNLTYAYNHPILCTYDDYMSVNGYSNGLKQIWINSKGKGLDDDFPYRLRNKFGNSYNFIKSNKSFVYHAVSINSKKLINRVAGNVPFKLENGFDILQFKSKINYGKQIQ